MKYLMPIVCLLLSSPPAIAAPLPDPTRPADYIPSTKVDVEEPESVEWKLNGITISSRGNSAIINGRVVTVGDQVASATVFEILPTGVVLDVGGNHMTVGLLPQTVKSLSSREAAKDSIEWSGL